MSPQELRAIVQQIDPELTYGTYILKQIKKYGPEREMLDDMSTAIKRFTRNIDDFDDKNIYNYTLRDLIELTSHYEDQQEDEEDELAIHPIKMSGVEFLKSYKIGDSKYYAYAIYDPDSLADLSEDTSWCVAMSSMGSRYLDKNAQVMIFKNESPTCLFNINGSEKKNSGNTEEVRPEILSIIDDIMNNYSQQIIQQHQAKLPPVLRLVVQFENMHKTQSINKFNPKNLTDEEQKILLSDIDTTMNRYVLNNLYEGEWPELKEAIKKHKRHGVLVIQHFINYGQKSGMNQDEIIEYLGALKEYGAETYAAALYSFFTYTRKRIPEYEQLMIELLGKTKGGGQRQYEYMRKNQLNQLLTYCAVGKFRMPEQYEDEALSVASKSIKDTYNASVLPAKVTYKCNILDAMSNKYDIKMRVVSEIADWDVEAQIRGNNWYITRQKVTGTETDINAEDPYNEEKTKERLASIIGRIELSDEKAGQFIDDPVRPRLGS